MNVKSCKVAHIPGLQRRTLSSFFLAIGLRYSIPYVLNVRLTLVEFFFIFLIYVRDHVQEEIWPACYEFPSAVHLLNSSLFDDGRGTD